MLPLEGPGDLVPVGLLVEEGGLDRRHVELLLLGRLARDDRVPPDEEAVVDEHLDAVLLRHELGAKALAGAALPDQGVDPDAPSRATGLR